MEQVRRKIIRLPQFDYSSNGAYFITICTPERKKLFGQADMDSPVKQMIAREFETALQRYIDENPLKWKMDRFYTEL